MKIRNLLGLAVAVLAASAAPLFAQTTQPVPQTIILSGAGLGAGIGAALALVGAGYGFSKIGSSALESMARQPEVAGQIQTAMIIIGALLEGATFFALLVCLLLGFNARF